MSDFLENWAIYAIAFLAMILLWCQTLLRRSLLVLPIKPRHARLRRLTTSIFRWFPLLGGLLLAMYLTRFLLGQLDQSLEEQISAETVALADDQQTLAVLNLYERVKRLWLLLDKTQKVAFESDNTYPGRLLRGPFVDAKQELDRQSQGVPIKVNFRRCAVSEVAEWDKIEAAKASNLQITLHDGIVTRAIVLVLNNPAAIEQLQSLAKGSGTGGKAQDGQARDALVAQLTDNLAVGTNNQGSTKEATTKEAPATTKEAPATTGEARATGPTTREASANLVAAQLTEAGLKTWDPDDFRSASLLLTLLPIKDTRDYTLRLNSGVDNIFRYGWPVAPADQQKLSPSDQQKAAGSVAAAYLNVVSPNSSTTLEVLGTPYEEPTGNGLANELISELSGLDSEGRQSAFLFLSLMLNPKAQGHPDELWKLDDEERSLSGELLDSAIRGKVAGWANQTFVDNLRERFHPHAPFTLGITPIRLRSLTRGPVPAASFLLFCWGTFVVITVLYGRLLAHLAYIPPPGRLRARPLDVYAVTWADVWCGFRPARGDDPVMRQVLSSNPSHDLLPFLFYSVFSQLAAGATVDSVHGTIESAADQWVKRKNRDSAFLEFVSWVLPACGFFGTLVGMGRSLSQVSGVVSKNPEIQGKAVGAMSSQMAMAFDATLVALTLLMVFELLKFLHTVLEGRAIAYYEDQMKEFVLSQVVSLKRDEQLPLLPNTPLIDTTAFGFLRLLLVQRGICTLEQWSEIVSKPTVYRLLGDMIEGIGSDHMRDRARHLFTWAFRPVRQLVEAPSMTAKRAGNSFYFTNGEVKPPDRVEPTRSPRSPDSEPCASLEESIKTSEDSGEEMSEAVEGTAAATEMKSSRPPTAAPPFFGTGFTPKWLTVAANKTRQTVLMIGAAIDSALLVASGVARRTMFVAKRCAIASKRRFRQIARFLEPKVLFSVRELFSAIRLLWHILVSIRRGLKVSSRLTSIAMRIRGQRKRLSTRERKADRVGRQREDSTLR